MIAAGTIASNMITALLAEAGFAQAPPPIATTLFRLTERGRELEEALLQLGRWGAPLLAHRAKGETLQPHWLVLPLKLVLVDRRPEDPDVNIELRAGGELMTITAFSGAINVRLGAAEGAAAVVTGKPETILQLFAGRIDLSAALAAGVRWEGAPEILHRVVPTASVNHAV